MLILSLCLNLMRSAMRNLREPLTSLKVISTCVDHDGIDPDLKKVVVCFENTGCDKSKGI